MKCFYHNDLDGKCAGFWVFHSAIVNDGSRHISQMIPIDYKDRFPIEKIMPQEQVYIVDFSLEPYDMMQLLEITKNVVWIDHHITAIEKYDDFPHAIRGIRVNGVSGCMLTYCYLHHMTHRGSSNMVDFEEWMMDEAPWFTQLIDDWDVWKFNYGDNTRYFKTACDAMDLRPESREWMEFIKPESYAELAAIDRGKVMIAFRDQWAKTYMELGFEVIFEGVKCFAVNLGRCNSEYFKSLPQGKYDVLMPFVFDGTLFTVSLYSETVDVSEIAKKYDGGGHKGAAGFQCKQMPFTKAQM